MQSTEKSPSDLAAERLRVLAASGGTIGSALLNAIRALRLERRELEARDVENALQLLPSLIEITQEMPEHLRESIDAYVERGREPGGFLLYVLENNLRRAIGAADGSSIRLLPTILRYCDRNVPPLAQGDVARVRAWSGMDDDDRAEELRAFRAVQS